jgi:hypothetical protein
MMLSSDELIGRDTDWKPRRDSSRAGESEPFDHVDGLRASGVGTDRLGELRDPAADLVIGQGLQDQRSAQPPSTGP